MISVPMSCHAFNGALRPIVARRQSPGQRSQVTLWLLLASMVALAVAGCTGIPSRAPDFTLTDQRGQAVSLAVLQGRTVLLTFLYTSCTDTCPLYLATIRSSLDLVVQTGREMPTVVVVTVDPDRDTVARLSAYASNWPTNWHFLTGTYQQLTRVWRNYGIRVERRPPPHASELHGSYSVDHSAKLIVVGPTGEIAAELTGVWSASQLAETIVSLDNQPARLQLPNLQSAFDVFLRQCGELARARPALFFGAAALLLPGVILPIWLFRMLASAKPT